MYFLSLLYLDKAKNNFRNTNLVGYWNTFEEADTYLKQNWPAIHEHWCNSALIEFYKVGSIHSSRGNRTFYYTEDINQVPVVCSEPSILKNLSGLIS